MPKRPNTKHCYRVLHAKRQEHAKEEAELQKVQVSNLLRELRTAGHYRDQGIEIFFADGTDDLQEVCKVLSTDGYVLTYVGPANPYRLYYLDLKCEGQRNPTCEIDKFLRKLEKARAAAAVENAKKDLLESGEPNAIREKTRELIDWVLELPDEGTHLGWQVRWTPLKHSDVFHAEAVEYCKDLSASGYVYTCSDLYKDVECADAEMPTVTISIDLAD